MLFKAVIAVVFATGCLCGCSQTPAEPDTGPKVESQGAVPKGAPMIKGTTAGGATEDAK